MAGADTPVVANGHGPLNGKEVNGQLVTNSVAVKKLAFDILPEEFYDGFLSAQAKRRTPSPIRGLFPLELTPGVLSLLAGKPNPSTFPITSIQLTARSPSDPTEETTLNITGPRLTEGLQYSATSGLPSLLKWVRGLQEHVHHRQQGEGWRVSIGAGSQELLYKAFMALINPGDPVLVESPAYAGIIPILQSLDCEILPVESDEQGIKPDSLSSIFAKRDAGLPMPKILYTVPYGCNPSGTTAAVERRREVLKLAHTHNFLILEDDPYFYLYFGKAPRPPSYFSLEVEQESVGRVVRFDSVSKILSAGMRIGFLTGPEPILRRIDLHTEAFNLQVPSITQAIVLSIFENWGYGGFLEHTHRVSDFYRTRRDIFERAMQKHLNGLAIWSPPEAGMFYWFKLLLTRPGSPATAEEDSEAIIRSQALKQGVLALPGTVFLPGGEKTAYVRASFSCLDEESIDEALRRLRVTILEARQST